MKVLVNKILQAVYDLHGMQCKDKDLIICFSPIIERLLIEELFNERWMQPMMPISNTSTLFNIRVNNEWPYNEIVVYDAKNAHLFPELLVKIAIQNEIHSNNIK
jgi:hypothetical protein